MRFPHVFPLMCKFIRELKNLASAIFKSITDEMMALKTDTNQELRKAAEQISALSEKVDTEMEDLGKESAGMVENLRFESEKRFDGLRQAIVNFGENLRLFGQRFDEQSNSVNSKVAQVQKTLLQDAKRRELELRLLLEENKERTDKQIKAVDQMIESGLDAQAAGLNELSKRLGQAISLQLENEAVKYKELSEAIQEQENRFSALEDRFAKETSGLAGQLLTTSESCLTALGRLNQKLENSVAGGQQDIKAQLEGSVIAAQSAIADLHDKLNQTANKSQKMYDQLNKIVFESNESLGSQISSGLADLENQMSGVVDTLNNNMANISKQLESEIEENRTSCFATIAKQEEAFSELQKQHDELTLKVDNLTNVSLPLMETKENIKSQIEGLSSRFDVKMESLQKSFKEAQTKGEGAAAGIDIFKAELEATKQKVSGLEIGMENIEANVTEIMTDCKSLVTEFDKIKGQFDRLDGTTDLNLGELKEQLQKAKGEMLGHLQAITESVNERDESSGRLQASLEERLKSCENNIQIVIEQAKPIQKQSTQEKLSEKVPTQQSIDNRHKEQDALKSKVTNLEQSIDSLQKELTSLIVITKPLLNNGQKEILDVLVKQVSWLEKNAKKEQNIGRSTSDVQETKSNQSTNDLKSVKNDISALREELLLQITELRQKQQNQTQEPSKKSAVFSNPNLESLVNTLNEEMNACNYVIKEHKNHIIEIKSDIRKIKQTLATDFQNKDSAQNVSNDDSRVNISSKQSLTKNSKTEDTKSTEKLNADIANQLSEMQQKMSEFVKNMTNGQSEMEEKFKTQYQQLATLTTDVFELKTDYQKAFATFKADIDKNVNKKMMSHRDHLHSEISENMQYLVDEAIAQLSKNQLESNKSLDKQKAPSATGVSQPEAQKSKQSKQGLKETSDAKIQEMSVKIIDLEQKYNELVNKMLEQKKPTQTIKESKPETSQSKEHSKTSISGDKPKPTKSNQQSSNINEAVNVESLAKKLEDFKTEVSLIIKSMNMKISDQRRSRMRDKEDRLPEQNSSAQVGDVVSLNRFNSDEIINGSNNLLKYESNDNLEPNNKEPEISNSKENAESTFQNNLVEETEQPDWANEKAVRHLSSMFLERIDPKETIARNTDENEKESGNNLTGVKNADNVIVPVTNHPTQGLSKYGLQELEKGLMSKVQTIDKKVADLNAQFGKIAQNLTQEVDVQVTAKIASLKQELLSIMNTKPAEGRSSRMKRNSKDGADRGYSSPPANPNNNSQQQVGSDPFITLKRTEQLIDEQIRKRLQNFKNEMEAKMERLRSEVALSSSSSGSITKAETARKLSKILQSTQIGDALMNPNGEPSKLAKTAEKIEKKMSVLEGRIDNKLKKFEDEVKRLEEVRGDILKGVDTENNRMRMFVQNENVNLMEKVEEAIKRQSLKPIHNRQLDG